MSGSGPRRIVCLTEETTETLYLLGEQDRIVGISGFTVRPPQARREKPRVSAFTSARIDRIVELKPDLVLGFSDLQADIAATLIRHGIEVHVFNQRSIAQILDFIRMLGGMIGAHDKAVALASSLERNVDAVRADVAGGENCFPELALNAGGAQRIIADPLEVVRRAPDVIIGSWCGKKFRPEQVCAREGWADVPAVRSGSVF